MDRPLQHNIIWVIALVQVEDDIIVVDPHIIQPASLNLLKQQLLLDTNAGAKNAYSHAISFQNSVVFAAVLSLLLLFVFRSAGEKRTTDLMMSTLGRRTLNSKLF